MKLKNKDTQVITLTIPVTVLSLLITVLTSLIPENFSSLIYYVIIISEVIFWCGIIVLAWLFLDWFEERFEKHLRKKIVEDYKKFLLDSFQNSITFEREDPNDWMHRRT